MADMIEFTCRYCGKKFLVNRRGFHGERQYCSRDCHNDALRANARSRDRAKKPQEPKPPKDELEYERVLPCKGCQYLGFVSDMGCCNYLFIVGKPRPCPPGKGCTAKVLGKRIPCPGEDGISDWPDHRREHKQQMPKAPKERKPRARRKAAWDTELGKELFLQGLSDGEAAAQLGIKPDAYARYRREYWGRKIIVDGKVAGVKPPSGVRAEFSEGECLHGNEEKIAHSETSGAREGAKDDSRHRK